MHCSRCFKLIDPQQRDDPATVGHQYPLGGFRLSDRRFHLSCFDEFLECGGRLCNPRTEFIAFEARVERNGEALYGLKSHAAE